MTVAQWECHAIPVRTGKVCGHRNTKGICGLRGILCCELCGATKIASDARLADEAAREKPRKRRTG